MPGSNKMEDTKETAGRGTEADNRDTSGFLHDTLCVVSKSFSKIQPLVTSSTSLRSIGRFRSMRKYEAVSLCSITTTMSVAEQSRPLIPEPVQSQKTRRIAVA